MPQLIKVFRLLCIMLGRSYEGFCLSYIISISIKVCKTDALLLKENSMPHYVFSKEVLCMKCIITCARLAQHSVLVFSYLHSNEF